MNYNIFSLPRVGQFMGVWADQTRNFGTIQFRVIGYSALNVFGMIGPELVLNISSIYRWS
jgi:hypothetical protein